MGGGIWPGPLPSAPELLDPGGELRVGEVYPGWSLEKPSLCSGLRGPLKGRKHRGIREVDLLGQV